MLANYQPRSTYIVGGHPDHGKSWASRLTEAAASVSLPTMVIFTFLLVVGFVVGWQLIENLDFVGGPVPSWLHVIRGIMAGALAATLVGLLASAKESRQRRITHELKNSEERFRTLVNQSTVALIGYDGSGRTTIWNPGAERLFDLHHTEVLGRQLWNLNFTEPTPDGRRLLVDRVFAGQSTSDEEWVYQAPDGPRLVLHTTNVPVRDHHGQIILGLLTGCDVTQRYEAEENLRGAYRELETAQAEIVRREKWATLGTFAASLGHEMKNPLSGLLGHVQLLERRAGRQRTLTAEELSESLSTIRREAGRLDGLINQFTEMARRGELRRVRCDLRSLAARTLALVEETAGRRNVTLTVTGEPEVFADADEARVSRALYNLILFAVDTSPPESVVALTVTSDANFARFLIPVSPEALRLSADGTTPPESMSTLGLTIAQEIARLHGGSIAFESNGQGNVLAFSLPRFAS